MGEPVTRDSELVTGEAVALELPPARLPSRALALLIDLLVAATVYVSVTLALLVSASSLDAAVEAAVLVASFVLVLVGGPVAVETLSHGRSLGKLVCGLRTVRDDGGPIRFRHALVRGAVGVVEIVLTLGTIACVASFVSARGRRVGDVLAGTLVVRERVPAGRPGLVPPPAPWLAARFSGLDLSGVPDGLWLAVRQYLVRMPQLDPRVSWTMAARLASDVAACTGTPAPSDLPPSVYLAAVLHQRQARDVSRVSGTNGLVDRPGGYPVPTAPAAPSPSSDTSAPPTPAFEPVADAPTLTSPPDAVQGSAPERSAGSGQSAGPASATGFVPPA